MWRPDETSISFSWASIRLTWSMARPSKKQFSHCSCCCICRGEVTALNAFPFDENLTFASSCPGSFSKISFLVTIYSVQIAYFPENCASIQPSAHLGWSLTLPLTLCIPSTAFFLQAFICTGERFRISCWLRTRCRFGVELTSLKHPSIELLKIMDQSANLGFDKLQERMLKFGCSSSSTLVSRFDC